MPDVEALVRECLLQDAALVTLCGGSQANICCDILPEKADPAVAPFVVVSAEGGTNFDEAPLGTPRIKLDVWAGKDQYAIAWQVYLEAKKQLHQKNGIDLSPTGFILSSYEVVQAQQLTDPDSGWARLVSFYNVMCRDS